MSKRQIVNIINFIRDIEPRMEMDLLTPVLEQIRLLKQYNLKGTFLLQYDALIDPVYADILKELDKNQFEAGVWFETVQPLVEKAGATWRGRYPWDWHSHCGFSVGYTREEREKLIDILFTDFKSIFGYYPKSFGSWAFDTYTLEYASDKYNLDAACNCKEQWGTDGYTLWGGYYGQGYYPGRKNLLAPSQTAGNQIATPLFRMLGSDPVYQYDCGLDISAGLASAQGVITLEPVYTGKSGGGGVEKWVDWYLEENFNGKCLSFGYTQAGQENSFGWNAMKNGLEYQFEKIAQLQSEGKLEVETLGETGRWYKNEYEITPPSTITALSDWKDSGKKSIWYSCKNYRVNFYSENDELWIRDIHLFRDSYSERYLFDTCKGNEMLYDNLPIIDGNRFSGNGIRAGIWFEYQGRKLKISNLKYDEKDGNAEITAQTNECGEIKVTLTEQGIKTECARQFTLKPRLDGYRASCWIDVERTGASDLTFTYNKFRYTVRLTCADIENDFAVSCGNSFVRLDV